MQQYSLLISLYTPTIFDHPDSLFDPWPAETCKDVDYLSDYNEHTFPLQSSSRDHHFKRVSRKPATSVTKPEIPPTPLSSARYHNKRDLTGRPDARFGLISMGAINERCYAAALKGSIHDGSPDHPIVYRMGFGILHLYKHDHRISEPLDTTIPPTPNQDNGGTVVCIIAIPSDMTVVALIEFLSSFTSCVTQLRTIRDVKQNKYTTLVKFHEEKEAQNFYQAFNGVCFRESRPEICHVVFVRNLKVKLTKIEPLSYPSMNVTLDLDQLKRNAFGDDKDESCHELPTCPVCLDRMDESITGLKPTECKHIQQCSCLRKWETNSCPACTYSQRPVVVESKAESSPSTSSPRKSPVKFTFDNSLECFICGATGSLWICMICEHVGCGRYQDAHAYDHFMETNHLYALEIETQRVWDYAGDGYVHRLIQNPVDGQIVEFSTSGQGRHGGDKAVTKAKMDALLEEYSSLLTSQLDSQREYYENHIESLSKDVSLLTTQFNGLWSEAQEKKQADFIQQQTVQELELELKHLQKENDDKQESMNRSKENYKAISIQLQEEQQLTAAELEENNKLHQALEEKKNAVQELRDQLQDLQFFLEARERVQENPELEGGSIETRHARLLPNRRKGKRRAK